MVRRLTSTAEQQEVERRGFPATKRMLRPNILHYARQAAMIFSTDSTLEALE